MGVVVVAMNYRGFHRPLRRGLGLEGPPGYSSRDTRGCPPRGPRARKRVRPQIRLGLRAGMKFSNKCFTDAWSAPSP